MHEAPAPSGRQCLALPGRRLPPLLQAVPRRTNWACGPPRESRSLRRWLGFMLPNHCGMENTLHARSPRALLGVFPAKKRTPSAVAREMPSPAQDIRRQCVPDTSDFPPAATAAKVAIPGTCSVAAKRRLFVARVLDGDATIDLRRQLGTSLKTDDNSVDRYKRRKKALQGQTQPCAHRGYREAVRLLHNRRSSLSLRRDLAGL